MLVTFKLDRLARSLHHLLTILKDLKERLRDVRQGPDGWLYVLTDSPDGQVWRLER